MRNVLVVEDDPHQRRILQKALESYGVSVVAVASVNDAKEALDENYEGFFSVAILDDMIIGGSGGDVLKHIRATDNIMPVLFLSARSDVIANRLYEGADNYLVKPQSPETIAAYVDSAISRLSAITSTVENRARKAANHTGTQN